MKLVVLEADSNLSGKRLGKSKYDRDREECPATMGKRGNLIKKIKGKEWLKHSQVKKENR